MIHGVLLRLRYQLERVDRQGSLHELSRAFGLMVDASSRPAVTRHLLVSEFLFVHNFDHFYDGKATAALAPAVGSGGAGAPHASEASTGPAVSECRLA